MARLPIGEWLGGDEREKGSQFINKATYRLDLPEDGHRPRPANTLLQHRRLKRSELAHSESPELTQVEEVINDDKRLGA